LDVCFNQGMKVRPNGFFSGKGEFRPCSHGNKQHCPREGNQCQGFTGEGHGGKNACTAEQGKLNEKRSPWSPIFQQCFEKLWILTDSGLLP
jgi:hypothetical protein